MSFDSSLQHMDFESFFSDLKLNSSPQLKKLNQSPAIKLNLLIPAFDSERQGLIIPLLLLAKPSPVFKLSAHGLIAIALAKSFTRVITIMKSLKVSWRCLEGYQYSLKSFGHFNVRDARSADLSLCIAALNLIRSHDHKPLVNDYMGTGLLRIDGTFNETFLEKVKEQAAVSACLSHKKFIRAKYCHHIFDLEALMENDSTKEKK